MNKKNENLKKAIVLKKNFAGKYFSDGAVSKCEIYFLKKWIKISVCKSRRMPILI